MNISFENSMMSDESRLVLESRVAESFPADCRVNVVGGPFHEWAAFTQDTNEYDVTIVEHGTLFNRTSALPRGATLDGMMVYDGVEVSRTSTSYMCDYDETVVASACHGLITFNVPLFGLLSGEHDIGGILDFLIEYALDEACTPTGLLEESTPDLTDAVRELLKTRDGNRVNDLRNQIETEITQIEKYQRRINGHKVTLRELQTLVDAALSVRDDGALNVDDVQREIAGLDRHAQVRAYSVVGNKVNVITEAIPITDVTTGDECPLGPYAICIDVGSCEVNIRNLVNRRGSFDHPHVRSGNFCAGEWQPTVNDLISQGKIAAAVAFVASCLGQVNRNDEWGRHAMWWFTDSDIAPDGQ